MKCVKVLTGRNRTRRITCARARDAKAMIADGWFLLAVDAALHPSEIVENVEELIKLAFGNGYDRVFFISNCDHVFNRIRVLRSLGMIDDAEFIQYNLNDDGTVRRDTVSVSAEGECSSYPAGFLEEWNNQLLQLMASSDEHTEQEESHEETTIEM